MTQKAKGIEYNLSTNSQYIQSPKRVDPLTVFFVHSRRRHKPFLVHYVTIVDVLRRVQTIIHP